MPLKQNRTSKYYHYFDGFTVDSKHGSWCNNYQAQWLDAITAVINDGSLKWEIASSLQFSIIFCEKTIVVYNKLNKHSSEAHVCGSSPLSNKDKQMVVNCWNSCADWFNWWWRNKGVFRIKNLTKMSHKQAIEMLQYATICRF